MMFISMSLRFLCRATDVLQHLAYVSPNATELVAMAAAACAARGWPLPPSPLRATVLQPDDSQPAGGGSQHSSFAAQQRQQQPQKQQDHHSSWAAQQQREQQVDWQWQPQQHRQAAPLEDERRAVRELLSGLAPQLAVMLKVRRVLACVAGMQTCLERARRARATLY